MGQLMPAPHKAAVEGVLLLAVLRERYGVA